MKRSFFLAASLAAALGGCAGQDAGPAADGSRPGGAGAQGMHRHPGQGGPEATRESTESLEPSGFSCRVAGSTRLVEGLEHDAANNTTYAAISARDGQIIVARDDRFYRGEFLAFDESLRELGRFQYRADPGEVSAVWPLRNGGFGVGWGIFGYGEEGTEAVAIRPPDSLGSAIPIPYRLWSLIDGEAGLVSVEIGGDDLRELEIVRFEAEATGTAERASWRFALDEPVDNLALVAAAGGQDTLGVLTRVLREDAPGLRHWTYLLSVMRNEEASLLELFETSFVDGQPTGDMDPRATGLFFDERAGVPIVLWRDERAEEEWLSWAEDDALGRAIALGAPHLSMTHADGLFVGARLVDRPGSYAVTVDALSPDGQAADPVLLVETRECWPFPPSFAWLAPDRLAVSIHDGCGNLYLLLVECG